MASDHSSEAARPRIEFLWWDECPSWERTLDILREAMVELGLDPASIELRKILTDDDAERGAFVGSPTIRVEGKDVQPPSSGERFGLACRVYRTRDGATSPLPDPADVREALSSAVAAAEGVS